jgi:hypothetical protein
MLKQVVILALALCVFAQTVPQWPPAPGYIVNITYTPGFYEGSEDMSGTYYYAEKLNRYAVDSKDPLRTFEQAVFLQDKKVQYVVSKFGMFQILI